MSSARRPPSPQAAPPGYAVVGTAGHIDHGKSALVRALTGVDPDRLEEEKRRGMTIDLGFAHFDLPSGRRVGHFPGTSGSSETCLPEQPA